MKRLTRSRKIVVALAVLGVVMAAAGLAYASGGEGSLSTEKLKDLGFRAMNFAALLFILVKYLKKPLVDGLSSRRMGIMTKFEELDERKGEAEKTYKTYEAKLGSIDQEVESILESAKAQAEVEKQRILDDANRAAEDIKRKAQQSVQNELSIAKKALREEVAEQAAAMAEELIRKNLTETDQSKLVEEYLDQVGAK